MSSTTKVHTTLPYSGGRRLTWGLGASDVFIGEYSCTLSRQTWSKVSEEERPELTKRFGQAQSARWQSKACGSSFWTLKMDWMPGGDWGFRKQVQDGNITSPACLRLPAAEVIERSKLAENRRTALMMTATTQHQSFWNDKAPERRFEHWRFADGVSNNLYLG
jgi:hypothetical protein